MKESKKKLALEKLTISKLNSPTTIEGGGNLLAGVSAVCNPTSLPPGTCTNDTSDC